MRHAIPAAAAFLAALLPTLLLTPTHADEKKQPPGLGDPGKLLEISVDTGRSAEGLFLVAGKDASQQLVVTGKYDSGQLRDLSRRRRLQRGPRYGAIRQHEPRQRHTRLDR